MTMDTFVAPPRVCSRCGQLLGSPCFGYQSRNSLPKEIWTCPSRHESWVWRHGSRRWKKCPVPLPVDLDAFQREAASTDAKRCPKCERRMIWRDYRDYASSSAADGGSVPVYSKWSCRCGHEQDVTSMISAASTSRQSSLVAQRRERV